MGERDRQIIKRIVDDFELANVNLDITQKNIAEILGEKPTTLSGWLKNDVTNFITLDTLAQLYQNLLMHKSPSLKALANDVFLVLVNTQYQALNLNSIDELIHKLEESKKYSAQKSESKLKKLASSNSITYLATSSTNVLPLLKKLFAARREISKFNLIICTASLSKSIVELEQWSYSKEGNYTDQLTIKLFTREQEPPADIIGMLIDSEFFAFLVQDGYRQMSELGYELLLEQEQRLTSEVPVWQLPKTPEARIISRLLRDMGDLLSPEVIGFLHQKIDFYESRQDTVYDSSYNVWGELNDEVVSGIRVAFDDNDAADKIADQLEFYKFLQ